MRKLVPLKSIYAFVAVAESGSMTEAAQLLSVSHSAISQAIKSLESQVNKPLFDRIGRHVYLNTEGKKYYRKVAPALEHIVDATEALMHDQNSQRITLNMVNSLALHWWIPRMPRLQAYAPQLDVRLSNLSGRFNLEQEGVDAALVHGNTEEWQDYYCEKLSEDELVLVCSPDLIDQRNPINLSDILKTYPLIEVTNERRKHDWQVWSDAIGVARPKNKKPITFNMSIQAVQATTRRLGVLVTHRLFVKDDIKYGQLIELGEPVINPNQQLYFVCPPHKLKQESFHLLRSWLKQEFA
ncbi:LysR family transcriptional regulator [Vibrio parahaemolyticus]|uniref:LysR substrate-binding domain-containing protein n=1 Tax=Vibrio parahaemolyticus TaxID=670 RepID=UPI0003F9DB50|nr:LysR substrate-binding domain-containing protein [Vibrio parahaemolyticus]EGR1567872.1 LysR family transcriptional regulator [Vibrio parahaemolyticus]EIE7519320.1 LysR family transcriptional regulator [Vibrio parahaemolyticus]EJC7969628.1 LysR family transcriptional regulator [Vibrio parahaemolyticus]MDF4336652.1 LysR substrate-binding domain-containing protein [Vibrio parahaemolyticus]MDF4929484.1 LysR substrate-binding domain-containing protein [Vibrio parahaemolyticus]